MSDEGPHEPRHWRDLLTGRLPLETETTVFILVNMLDFFATYWLLQHSNELGVRPFTESNPVARFFLDRWGIKGLLGFKLAIVVFVCVVAQIVALRREATGRRLLQFGTVVVFGVVVYSASIYLRHLGYLG